MKTKNSTCCRPPYEGGTLANPSEYAKYLQLLHQTRGRSRQLFSSARCASDSTIRMGLCRNPKPQTYRPSSSSSSGLVPSRFSPEMDTGCPTLPSYDRNPSAYQFSTTHPRPRTRRESLDHQQARSLGPGAIRGGAIGGEKHVGPSSEIVGEGRWGRRSRVGCEDEISGQKGWVAVDSVSRGLKEPTASNGRIETGRTLQEDLPALK